MSKETIFDLKKTGSLLQADEICHLNTNSSGMDYGDVAQLDQVLGQRAFDNSNMVSAVAMAVAIPLIGRWTLGVQAETLPKVLEINNAVLREGLLASSALSTIMSPLMGAASIFKVTGEAVYNVIAKPLARRNLLSTLNEALVCEGVKPIQN
ncbi:MAG: hypothetical protein WC069_03515 [Candidatus Shapirobacteria bacterium]